VLEVWLPILVYSGILMQNIVSIRKKVSKNVSSINFLTLYPTFAFSHTDMIQCKLKACEIFEIKFNHKTNYSPSKNSTIVAKQFNYH